MKTISLRIDSDLLADVDRLVKPFRYSNRTELIRQAVREFVEKLENDRERKSSKKNILVNDEIIAELEKRFGELKQ